MMTEQRSNDLISNTFLNFAAQTLNLSGVKTETAIIFES